jgi:hypothetical protein
MDAMLVRQLAVVVLGCVKRDMSITDVVRYDCREKLDVIERVSMAAHFLLLERLNKLSINLIDSPGQLPFALDLFSPKFLDRRFTMPR